MIVLRLLVVALLLLASSPGEAHRAPGGNGPWPTGVSIPSLTHGQMAVISENLPAIRALASSRIGDDMTVWRLEDYLYLQSFACLWGLVPDSIEDEGSPFNECAHAYLAAARALLLQLREAPGVNQKAVEALISKIGNEMALRGASLILCRFSDEPFNTNQVVFPKWHEIPFHAPTALFILSVIAGIGLAGWGLWPRPTRVAR